MSIRRIFLTIIMATLLPAFTHSMAYSMTLKIADNHSAKDSTVKALEYFAKDIKDKSDGKIKAKVFSSGVLGDEREVLQQVSKGIIDIARVSTANLSHFQPKFRVLSMPYLFRDMQHFKNFAKSEVAKSLLDSTTKDDIICVTFYTNGFRSFYTKDTAIYKPADLSGLKIRVMGDPVAIEMVDRLGGKATPMALSEVFSAIQQGVIDGAESAVTVLTIGSHGEIAKKFSFDEHSLLPDIVCISKKKLRQLKDYEQEMILNRLRESWDYQDKLYNEDIKKAYETAKDKMGVDFNQVDKQPFIELVEPMYDSLPNDEKKLATEIRSIQ